MPSADRKLGAQTQFRNSLAKLSRKFIVISMMRLALGLAFALASPAGAEGDLCPLVQRLNAVIAAGTDYAPPPGCPEIGFAALPEGGGWRSQAGAFDPATGRIELAPDLDLTTAYGQSFLLHELHHAAQFAAGADKRMACAQMLEAEAYRLQADFLQDHGLGREAMMTRVLAGQLGTCPGSEEY
jgi:hypothetical protein